MAAGIDSFTRLLLQADGIDGSVTFTDLSPAGNHTISATGQVHHQKDDSGYGASVFDFDGFLDALTVADSTDFDFSSSIFVIDTRVKFDDYTDQDQTIFSSNNDYVFGLVYNEGGSGKLGLYLSSNGTTWDISNGQLGSHTVWDTEAWYHIALVWDGNNYKLYINGAEDLVIVSSLGLHGTSGFRVGMWSDSTMSLSGSLQEIRVSKGAIRWSVPFTPPTEGYTKGTLASHVIDGEVGTAGIYTSATTKQYQKITASSAWNISEVWCDGIVGNSAAQITLKIYDSSGGDLAPEGGVLLGTSNAVNVNEWAYGAYYTDLIFKFDIPAEVAVGEEYYLVLVASGGSSGESNPRRSESSIYTGGFAAYYRYGAWKTQSQAYDLTQLKIFETTFSEDNELVVTLPSVEAGLLGGQGSFVNVNIPLIESTLLGSARLESNIPLIEPTILGGARVDISIPVVEAFIGGAGAIDTELSLITPILEGSDNLNHGNLITTLPSLSVVLGEAESGTLNTTIPTITAVMNESVSRGNISATLPLITIDVLGGVGSFLEVDLPLITSDIVSGVLLNVDIPMITVSAEGVCGEAGELEIILPTITVSTTGKVEILGSINTLLPTLQAHVKGLTGKLIAGNVTLPTVQADIAGYNDLTGDIDLTVAMLTAYMTGTPTRFAACSYILRYDDLLDCLGGILTELPIIAVSIED